MKPILLFPVCAVIVLIAVPAAAQWDTSSQYQLQSEPPSWQPPSWQLFETERDYQIRQMYQDFQRRQDARELSTPGFRGNTGLAPEQPLRRSRENYGYGGQSGYR